MSAPWKQILESESNMTAVCDSNSSKPKSMNLCENSGASLVAESSTSEHESVAGSVVKEKPQRASNSSKEILAMKETVEQVRMRSLTGQEKQVKILPKKDVVGHFHQASSEDSARKLQAMNNKLDVELNKDGNIQLAELATMVRALKKEMEIVETVELDVSRESLWDMVKEGSSLRSLLESLELKLETFLSQKLELKDNKAHTVNMLHRGCELEAGFDVDENNKADLMRTKSCRAALQAAEELTLAVEEVYKDKAFQARTLSKIATLSGGIDAVCVSNSESCAKVVIPGKKLESCREKEEDSNKLVEGEVAAAMSHVDADLTESSCQEFSIRNFVSASRNKDMKNNWPFSRRSLKVCLKSGVKTVLPPFQSFDSVRNNLAKHCLTETASPPEISRLDKNPCWLKNQPASGSFYHGFDQKSALHCTDSNSSPSAPSGNRDFVMETTAHSQSEMESVSTSKVPLSEASDKHGAAAPAFKQKLQSESIFIPNKKRKVVIKLGANMDHGSAEDIASTRGLPPEAVAPKICPVCGNFSSSSNTKLNAHIDQCLSVQPTSEWIKSSKTVKHKIKPRKIRLISEILVTAPCCTVEELDIRNGRIPVADANLASDTNKFSEGRNQRESLGHVKDTNEDCAVYVDANGTKIRILSKTNDVSSLPKDLKTKTSLKKGKRSKLLSSNTYVTKQACVDGKEKFTIGAKQQEKELSPSIKIHEQNKVIESGNSMQSLCAGKTVLAENSCCKRKRGRPRRKVPDTRFLLAVSHEPDSTNSNIHKDIERSSTMKAGIDLGPNSIKRNTSSCKVVVDADQHPRGKTKTNFCPLFAKNQFSREICFVPEDLEATQIHSCADKKAEDHANTIEQNDQKSDFHDPERGTRIERSRLSSIDEAPVASSPGREEQCNSMEAVDDANAHDKNELIDTNSSAKLLTGGIISDPKFHGLTKHSGSESSLLKYSGNLFGSASAIQLTQPCLDDIHEMFNATEGEINAVEQGTSFPLFDSLSIPGPPGSYLPSFRESCFEYLQGSSSLANGLANSDTEAGKLTSDVASSWKDGITWNAALNVQESQLLRRRMVVVPNDHLGSNLNTEAKNLLSIHENQAYASVKSALGSGLTINSTVMKSPSSSDCESPVLSPPVLRLMGKDVMVLTNDDNATDKSKLGMSMGREFSVPRGNPLSKSGGRGF